jgi:tripartite-type tricarboxylate transporter receptor subunit TctC
MKENFIMIFKKISLLFLSMLFSASVMASQSVLITVPSEPGSTLGQVARILQKKLNEKGTNTRIEYRPGAQLSIGTQHHLSSTPQNNEVHLLISTTVTLTNYYITKMSTLDPLQDLDFLLPLSRSKILIHARKDFPVSSLADLDKTGLPSITYGTPGIGTGLHTTTLWLSQYFNTNMIHIPYASRYASNAPADVSSGVIDIVADSGSFVGLAQSGRTKIIAVLDDEEWTKLPGAKTLKEQGLEMPPEELMTHTLLFGHQKNDIKSQEQVVEILRTAFKTDPVFKEDFEKIYNRIPGKRELDDPLRWWREKNAGIKKISNNPIFNQLIQEK